MKMKGKEEGGIGVRRGGDKSEGGEQLGRYGEGKNLLTRW